MVCPAGRPEPARKDSGVWGEGRGSLNLDAILRRSERENIKKLETGSELFMNTPRFSSAVVILLVVILLAVLVVLLIVVLLVVLIALLIILVVLIGHDNYLLLKECNSSMSMSGHNIQKV